MLAHFLLSLVTRTKTINTTATDDSTYLSQHNDRLIPTLLHTDANQSPDDHQRVRHVFPRNSISTVMIRATAITTAAQVSGLTPKPPQFNETKVAARLISPDFPIGTPRDRKNLEAMRKLSKAGPVVLVSWFHLFAGNRICFHNTPLSEMGSLNQAVSHMLTERNIIFNLAFAPVS